MTDTEKVRRMKQNLLSAEQDIARRQANVDRLRAELNEARDHDEAEYEARQRVHSAYHDFQDAASAGNAQALADAASAYVALASVSAQEAER